jgi:hypothetical protein
MVGNFDLQASDVLVFFLVLAGVGLVAALMLLGWVLWRVRRIKLPPDADLITTLRATPIVVVILLDLLDLSLDFLSAPFSWTLLSYLGLNRLRNVTVIESLIPGTQFIPTMTAAWALARLVDPERLPRILRSL